VKLKAFYFIVKSLILPNMNSRARDALMVTLLAITAISSVISAMREQPSIDVDIASELTEVLQNCRFELTGLYFSAWYNAYDDQLSRLEQGREGLFGLSEGKTATLVPSCTSSPYNVAP
jgi:hypothetical protein